MSEDIPPDAIVTHAHPAWQQRANFIIRAAIPDPTPSKQVGQLFCQQIDRTRFILCCIPFFLYDLALGDEVMTNDAYELTGVAQLGGHFTFRALCEGTPDVQDFVGPEVMKHAKKLDCLYEWYSARLVAIDAPDYESARAISGVLFRLEEAQRLHYETGRT